MNPSTRLSRASKNVQMGLWFQNHLHLWYDCHNTTTAFPYSLKLMRHRKQQTKDGWPPKQISWNPYPTSTTARNPDRIENKNPKPPRPWLPPIKEVAEIVADVELTPEQWAKELKPVAELNARTPRPLPFHEKPASIPTWHAGCPDGYEPTSFAGFPLRRPYPMWLPAVHDPNQGLNRYGHWCIHEEDDWNWCVMGKCAGCLVCRPGGS